MFGRGRAEGKVHLLYTCAPGQCVGHMQALLPFPPQSGQEGQLPAAGAADSIGLRAAGHISDGGDSPIPYMLTDAVAGIAAGSGNGNIPEPGPLQRQVSDGTDPTHSRSRGKRSLSPVTDETPEDAGISAAAADGGAAMDEAKKCMVCHDDRGPAM